MSGAWAREADSAVCLGAWNLADAALWLADALNCDGAGRAASLLNASAIIRRERRRLDPEGKSLRYSDWPKDFSDDSLIWSALRMVAAVDVSYSPEGKTWCMRVAESALRTLHKRGRS